MRWLYAAVAYAAFLVLVLSWAKAAARGDRMVLDEWAEADRWSAAVWAELDREGSDG